MATYNGEKYIIKQLDSIYHQTLQADEVLIRDDCSTDKTVSVIKNFIAEKHLEKKWRVEINDCNKGYVKNFLDGAKDAKGEIIFYSDQDDIWDVHKIEHMANGFSLYPDMLACYCLKKLIDVDDNELPMKYEFMTNVSTKHLGFRKITFAENIKYNRSSGLCLAVKKELIQEIGEMIFQEKLTHDLPVGAVASLKKGYYVLNERLVYHRQHFNNASSPRNTISSRITNEQKQIEGRLGRLKQMKAIYVFYSNEMNTRDKLFLKRAINATEKSIRYLKKKDLFHLFFLIFDKNPMMNKWIGLNNFLTCLYHKF